MELNKDNYNDLISGLPNDTKVYFYESLAHNLTIVCREIWSDDTLSDGEKIKQMKWLNEIQHSIVSKIQVVRLSLHEWTEASIIGMIEDYFKQSPGLRSKVTWALKSSYKTTIENAH